MWTWILSPFHLFSLKIRIFLQHPHLEEEMSPLMYIGPVPCQATWLRLKGVSRWPYCLVACTWDIHLISQRAWQNPSHSTWSSVGLNHLGKGRDWFALMTWKAWLSPQPIFLRPECKCSSLIVHTARSIFSKSAPSKNPQKWNQR